MPVRCAPRAVPCDPAKRDPDRVTDRGNACKDDVAGHHSLWRQLGPGVVSGAADDDPSGIATYSQVGAAFGFGMLWNVVFTLPLMVAIQLICARIGRVTGQGIAAHIRHDHSKELLYTVVGLLLVANIINIAADLGAMGAALKLLAGGPLHWYVVGFGIGSLLLQIFVPFPRYAPLFLHVDPIKALFWSTVINGVIAVPIMVLIMVIGGKRKIMGEFAIRGWLKALGWCATTVMGLVVVTMFATWGH